MASTLDTQTVRTAARSFDWMKAARYVPRWWLAILVVMVALHVFVPVGRPLWDWVINISLLFLFSKVVVIIHETGHLLAAFWAGGRPRRMILGIGHEIYRGEINGIKVILNSIPAGGAALATFEPSRQQRWRYAIYYAGGVLANLTAALVFYIPFGFEPGVLIAEQDVDVASVFIFVNLATLINLVPFYSTRSGLRMPTDGLGLLFLLSKERHQKRLRMEDRLYEAYQLLEEKNYEQARNVFREFHQRNPNDIHLILLLTVAEIKQGHYSDVIQRLEKLLETTPEKDLRMYVAVVYNNLAWCYLLLNDIDQSYRWATLAIDKSKGMQLISTYGAVLIEKGHVETGMQWLFKCMDLKIANSTTLSASSFLMLAYHLRGDHEGRDLHRTFVETHLNQLDPDDLLLWQRNKSRVDGEQS